MDEMYDPYEELVKMTNKKTMIHKIKSIPIVHDKVPPKSGKSRKTTYSYRIDDIKEENSKEPGTPNHRPSDSRNEFVYLDLTFRNNFSSNPRSNSNFDKKSFKSKQQSKLSSEIKDMEKKRISLINEKDSKNLSKEVLNTDKNIDDLLKMADRQLIGLQAEDKDDDDI